MQVVYVQDAQFQCTHHQTGSIDADAAIAIRKELLYEFVLPFLQALHAKWHSAKVGDLVFCISEGQMTEKTLIVFIDIVVNQRFLAHELVVYALLKSLDDLFQDGLVEDKPLAVHHTCHITACEQFAAFEDDAVAAGIQGIYPKFLVEYLP